MAAALTLSRKRGYSFFLDDPHHHSPSPLSKRRICCSSPATAFPTPALPPTPSVDSSNDNGNSTKSNNGDRTLYLQLLESFQKENQMLKEQLASQQRDNTILKRAVEILDGRQKDYDANVQELQKMKETVSEYKEKLRVLEVNNYALTMHLTQAQQSSPMPGHFNRDVF